MTDRENGYLSGQDGLVMRTTDGGTSWQRLNSRTRLFIFALSFSDRLHGFLVGDRSLVLSTADGGESFLKRQLERQFPPELRDYALPYDEPILYGVDFTDNQHGWVVGEFGGSGPPTTAGGAGRRSNNRWSANGSARSDPTTIRGSPTFNCRPCFQYRSATGSTARRAGWRDG